MKKLYILLLILISIFLNTKIVKAWDSTAAKYMPLQAGNTWVYYSENHSPYPFPTSFAYQKYEITSTVDTLGKKYFRVQLTVVNISGSGYCPFIPFLVRIDSSSMNLCTPGSNCYSNESILDSLLSGKNDTAVKCSETFRFCKDTASFTIFNSLFPIKEFIDERGNNTIKYCKSIGIIYYGWGEAMNWCFSNLKGCVINGTVFGDTNMIVGINQISSEIPGKYELSQNYPNPFNPVTHFGFRIADFGFVRLTVYDVLGKELQTLVNEELHPGRYEADWDATIYPSGVYYYKLESGTFTETKKMVLIK